MHTVALLGAEKLRAQTIFSRKVYSKSKKKKKKKKVSDVNKSARSVRYCEWGLYSIEHFLNDLFNLYWSFIENGHQIFFYRNRYTIGQFQEFLDTSNEIIYTSATTTVGYMAFFEICIIWIRWINIYCPIELSFLCHATSDKNPVL